MSGGLTFKVFEAPQVPAGVKLSEAHDVAAFMGSWSQAAREVFNVIYLNASGRVLHVEPHSMGDAHSSGVFPSEIFKLAFSLNSCRLILVHNHPSGDPSPSRADKEMTASLVIVGDMLGVQIADHVIIGGDGFYSFQESGLIYEASRDGQQLLGSLSVRDSADERGCPECLFYAGELPFSRFHCWRRVKSGAPAAGDVCAAFWPASDRVPVPAGWAEVSSLPAPVPADPVSGAPVQLALFGGEK